jgi:L-lactate dehydrogenase complex protein LldF
MRATSRQFVDNAARARDDAKLQAALGRLNRDTRASALRVRGRLPEFDALRDAAVEIKSHSLARLDHYLEMFERNVVALGGHVHWCRDAEEACAAILGICRQRGATMVAKGKSMVSEEIALNDHLERNGVRAVETDLGEYILQLRGETPSHIVMPAIHLTQDGIADTFREHHGTLDAARPLDEARDLTDEARAALRETFLGAEIGITGANFLIAESGTAVIVTNEGNGDLVQTLPPVHVVVTGIEKVIPSAEDAFTLLRILARSATGQEISCYTTFATGPRRDDDDDGPEEYHVVLLDNGRSELLANEFRDALRCIRCGACQSVCPVYRSVGGHAYGWVYGGPIGSILTPAMVGHDAARDLPEASSFCGACEEICPVRIPLPDLLRRWRERAHRTGLSPARTRAALALWGWLARRPGLYRVVMRTVIGALAAMGRRRGRFRRLPLAGGWTGTRDLPAPEGGTFMTQWRAR